MRRDAAALSKISAANLFGDCADWRAASTISLNNSFEIRTVMRVLILARNFSTRKRAGRRSLPASQDALGPSPERIVLSPAPRKREESFWRGRSPEWLQVCRGTLAGNLDPSPHVGRGANVAKLFQRAAKTTNGETMVPFFNVKVSAHKGSPSTRQTSLNHVLKFFQPAC